MAVVHAGVLEAHLRLPAVASLKEKRQVIKSLLAHVARTHQVAVAEVDHNDLWQRSTIAVAAVANSAGHLDRILHSVTRELEREARIELLSTSIAYLEEPS